MNVLTKLGNCRNTNATQYIKMEELQLGKRYEIIAIEISTVKYGETVVVKLGTQCKVNLPERYLTRIKQQNLTDINHGTNYITYNGAVELPHHKVRHDVYLELTKVTNLKLLNSVVKTLHDLEHGVVYDVAKYDIVNI